MDSNQRHALAVAALIVTAALLFGCEPMTDQAEPEPVYFTMGVEQDGQRIPVRDHTVRIRRAPFRLVFYFEEMGSMLVDASLEPDKGRALQKGANLHTIFPPGASVAEHLQNPERSLYIGGPGYHNWLYLGPKTHRFDPGAVHKLGARGFICRRTVEKLVDTKAGKVIPLDELQADRLYLGFVQTQRVPGSDGRYELQRDWLTIEFLDP
ncbi:MAG: hypothetical protein GVY16_08465 [Planctomycetes bacterium]|jgi:nitrous oxide reductase accessory protein NosL|nr:hypothetical protein [Phycisphaerae bacterium]NBB95759.1 hypothetical protein [Planctomycetota bacterium]